MFAIFLPDCIALPVILFFVHFVRRFMHVFHSITDFSGYKIAIDSGGVRSRANAAREAAVESAAGPLVKLPQNSKLSLGAHAFVVLALNMSV